MFYNCFTVKNPLFSSYLRVDAQNDLMSKITIFVVLDLLDSQSVDLTAL